MDIDKLVFYALIFIVIVIGGIMTALIIAHKQMK
jgi:hypothetical protein